MRDVELVHRPGEQLRRAAYHECGHILAAHVLGFEIHWVSVVTPPDSPAGKKSQAKYLWPGHTDDTPDPIPPLSADERAEMEKQAVVTMAGLIAEQIGVDSDPSLHDDPEAHTKLLAGFQSDRRRMEQIADFLEVPAADRQTFLAETNATARRLVEQYRPTLVALAVAAAAQRYLDRTRLLGILQGVGA